MINHDDWLSAVKEAENAPLPHTDAISIKEFAALLGLKRCQASRRMQELVESGKATRTSKLIRRNTGDVVSVPAYLLVKSERKKRR